MNSQHHGILLEAAAKQLGCYLSDLRTETIREELLNWLSSLPENAVSPEEWQYTLDYLLSGQQINKEEALAILNAFWKK